MALEVFTAARIGLEATRGTSVTPTRNLSASSFIWEQTIATIRPEELRNNYEGWWSATAGVERNTFQMNGRNTYEQMILLGNMFVAPLGTASGTTISGGTAWTFTFTPSGTADNVKTGTVQVAEADTIATAPGVELKYLFGQTLNLHWEKNDDAGLQFDASYLSAGTATQITAFTGSPTDLNQFPVSMNNTQTYIDATTIGTTADTNVVSVDWTLNLNPVPFYSLNNSAGVTSVFRPQHRAWTARIVRQYASNSEWNVYGTKAERKIRVRSLGTAVAGINDKVDLDLYGVITERSKSNVDGITTEELTLEPIVDTGAGTISFQLVVVNHSFGTL